MWVLLDCMSLFLEEMISWNVFQSNVNVFQVPCSCAWRLYLRKINPHQKQSKSYRNISIICIIPAWQWDRNTVILTEKSFKVSECELNQCCSQHKAANQQFNPKDVYRLNYTCRSWLKLTQLNGSRNVTTQAGGGNLRLRCAFVSRWRAAS